MKTRRAVGEGSEGVRDALRERRANDSLPLHLQQAWEIWLLAPVLGHLNLSLSAFGFTKSHSQVGSWAWHARLHCTLLQLLAPLQAWNGPAVHDCGGEPGGCIHVCGRMLAEAPYGNTGCLLLVARHGARGGEMDDRENGQSQNALERKKRQLRMLLSRAYAGQDAQEADARGMQSGQKHINP